MTSDVQARTRTGLRLPDVFAALFPCGSVTGAPKVRAMQLIRELERQPAGHLLRRHRRGAAGWPPAALPRPSMCPFEPW